MKNEKVNVISMAIIAIIVVAVLFVSCKPKNDDPKSKSQSQILVPSSSRSTTLPKKQVTSTPNTRYDSSPFSRTSKENLYRLPTTGDIDAASPELYMSPRYEAILGGDYSSGVPLSELDKATNSDLDESTFFAAQKLATSITIAQISGKGAEAFPTYFNEDNLPGECLTINVKHVGATRLPIPSDSRWIIAYVVWSASCSADGTSTYNVSQQTNVYMTVDGGQLTPRQLSEIPTS